jgi:ABC-type dipeptide/oligopeptide/nickel transport system permease subunit
MQSLPTSIGSPESWARYVSGSVLSVKNNEYITAARVVGVPSLRITFRHDHFLHSLHGYAILPLN